MKRDLRIVAVNPHHKSGEVEIVIEEEFDVLVFLKHIDDNKGKFFNPYVYSCIFRHIDVDDKVEKYKESLMDEEVLKKLKRERILNRLTEEEKEILGVE